MLQPRDRGILYVNRNQGSQQIIKNIPVAIKDIFSTAFNLVGENRMNEKQSKIFITSNILKNYVNQNSISSLDNSYLLKLHSQIYGMTEYLLQKYEPYPQNTKESAQAISKQFRLVDNLDALHNCYLKNSEVVFQLRNSKDCNYNDLIMRVINELATKLSNNRELFYEKVSKITYQKVQSPFLDSFVPFTDKEIKNHYLAIKTPQIEKLLMDWIKQLLQKIKTKKYYSKIAENVFLPKSKKDNNLQHWMKSQLDQELDKEREYISTYIGDLSNSVINQLKACMSHKKDKNKEKDSQTEKRVLQFETEIEAGNFAIKYREKYHEGIIKLLNRLIHGLLLVSDRFFKRQVLSPSAWPEPPCLLSFRPSQLLRLKIPGSIQSNLNRRTVKSVLDIYTGKGNEIVKVQDRLLTQYSDVVVIVRIANKILAEVSIDFNENNHNFEKLSNSFHKIAKQMISHEFGVIASICNMWINEDSKFNYFKKKLSVEEPIIEKNESEQVILMNLSPKYQKFVLNRIKTPSQKIPKFGIALFKFPKNQLKTAEAEPFVFFEDKETKYLIGIEKGQLYIIEDITTQSNYKTFLQNNYIFVTQDIKYFSERELTKKYILPKYIKECYFKQKQTLSLINNQLNDQQLNLLLKEGSQEDKAVIKNLFLTDNNITRVDYFCQNFSNVQWLELNHTKVSNFEQIEKMKNLKMLVIDECIVPEIPQSVCKLAKFERLSASQAGIKVLPDEIINWKECYHIQADFNEIQIIPDNICFLSKLITLNLNGNHIKSLPQKIGNLQLLKNLFVNQNKLQSLPQSLFEILNLSVLTFNKNKVQKIDKLIGKLTNLKKLDMSNNQIADLPNEIKELTNLTELHVNNNRIKVIGDYIENCQNLTLIAIENNPIEAIQCVDCIVIKGNSPSKDETHKYAAKVGLLK